MCLIGRLYGHSYPSADGILGSLFPFVDSCIKGQKREVVLRHSHVLSKYVSYIAFVVSVSLFASHRFWKQKYDDILGSGERIILSKCIRQYGSIIDSAWISLTLLADTRATKSTVFKVRFLSELSSIGTNGGERNPLSTVGMSQVGVLFILAGLALLSDIRNRFISGSFASLVSMNE